MGGGADEHSESQTALAKETPGLPGHAYLTLPGRG